MLVNKGRNKHKLHTLSTIENKCILAFLNLRLFSIHCSWLIHCSVERGNQCTLRVTDSGTFAISSYCKALAHEYNHCTHDGSSDIAKPFQAT